MTNLPTNFQNRYHWKNLYHKFKSNTKAKNENPKHILTIPAKFVSSHQSKINDIQPSTDKKQLKISNFNLAAPQHQGKNH